MLGMILGNLLVLVIPYIFVQYIFLGHVLFRDSQPSSLTSQRLFALTVSICFHSHVVLLLDVLDMLIRDPAVRLALLTADVIILLALLIFVFPTCMIWYMTRTLLRWRKTGTVLLQVLLLLGAWEFGSLFPTNDQNSK